MPDLSWPNLSRLTLAIAIGGLLLTGCAHQPTARTTETTSATTTHSDSTRTRSKAPARTTGNQATASLPENTGIPACDDYLSSYLACHRAAAIYTPDQLQPRYEAMRTSLLRDSQDPAVRPSLAARCNSLATALREALHGKSCADNPAAPGSSP